MRLLVSVVMALSLALPPASALAEAGDDQEADSPSVSNVADEGASDDAAEPEPSGPENGKGDSESPDAPDASGDAGQPDAREDGEGDAGEGAGASGDSDEEDDFESVVDLGEEEEPESAGGSDSPDGEAAQADAESDGQASPVDLSGSWSGGDARIDEGGDYILSADVESETPLHVALPEGERATVYFGSHSATVSGGAASALDLTENKGDITFTSEALEGAEDDGEESDEDRSRIVLVADDASDKLAVVVVRASEGDAEGDVPHARLAGIELTLEASAHSREALESNAAVVRALEPEGADEEGADDDAPAPEAHITLDGCALDAAIDRSPDEEALSGEGEIEYGSACAIDTAARGIELAGATSVETRLEGSAYGGDSEGDDGAPSRHAVFASAWDDAFEFAEGFELEGDIEFGFPSELEDGEEATVASADEEAPLSADVSEKLHAQSGYSLNLDRVEAGEGVPEDESQRDIVRVRLVADLEDEAGIAEVAAEAGDGEGAAASEEVEEGDPVAQDVSEEPAADQSSAQEPAATESAHAAPAIPDMPSVLKSLGIGAQSIEEATLAAQAEGTDLNAAWKGQSGGTAASYTITEGGTYYLSDDLKADGSLVVDAKGADVVIRFQGHELSLVGVSSSAGSTSAQTLVAVKSAKSVKLDGAASSGRSSLANAASSALWGVSSTAADCALSINDLSISLKPSSTSIRAFHTHAVRASSGNVALRDCTLAMGFGEQTLRSAQLASCVEPPSAVFAEPGVGEVSLEGCTVTAVGAPGFALSDMRNVTALGNVYALYSSAATTKVSGGSYAATSLRGNATCLFGQNLLLTGSEPIALESNAGQIASGVLSTGEGAAYIDAPIAFGCADDYEGLAEARAALCSSVEGGFAFGPGCLEGEPASLTALVMTGDLAAANDDGARIGSASGFDSSQFGRLEAVLSNAFGADAPCVVATDAQGARFALEESNAAAIVANAAGEQSAYATLPAALAALEDGGTLTLLKDGGDVDVSSVGSATIDLGGHSVKTLSFTATSESQPGLVVKNGAVSGTRAYSRGGQVAVYYNAASPLTLSNVAISASWKDSAGAGVYADRKASGPLAVTDGSRIDVRIAQRKSNAYTAYGIRVDSGNSDWTGTVLDGSTIDVRTAGPGDGVTGIDSRTSTTVTNSAIKLRSEAGSAGGLLVSGACAVRDSTIDVRTASPSSSVFGIRATNPSKNGPATMVSLDAGKVVLACAADASGMRYTCLQGATQQSSTSSASWALSGECTFVSPSGTHIGLNAGDFELAGDFALGPESDAVLSVSQAKRDGDVGFASADGRVISQNATLFAPETGSYYEGWALGASADGTKLIWRPAGAAADGAVEVVHEGAVTRYATASEAIAAAVSGDTVRLLCDLAESNRVNVAQDDLVLDLNGKSLSLRGGAGATAANGGVIAYSGAGTLEVRDGTLGLSMGAATEPASGAVYQGITVSGGGVVRVAADAVLDVRYTGGTTSSAQNNVAMRGAYVGNGSFELEGILNVSSAMSDGAIGALEAYGVFVQTAQGVEGAAEPLASVDLKPGASVTVENRTAPATTKSMYYPESVNAPQSPAAIREIHVDPDLDQQFYQDILLAFRRSATYDDGSGNNGKDPGARVYYASSMTLDRDGAWYDGLKVWAYSDVVAKEDVGKLASITPAHFFVSTEFDVLPQAYGIATSGASAGAARVNVQGAVSAASAHGEARTLLASGGERTAWTCDAESLSAQADDRVHVVREKTFDLRDFVAVSSDITSTVSYRGTGGSALAAFHAPIARNVVVSEGVDFSLAGTPETLASGIDAATIEAAQFKVGNGFAPHGTCTVAHPDGANEPGALFAVAMGEPVDEAVFEDAYGALASEEVEGGLTWGDAAESNTVTFKVGEAVVKRYASPDSIDLAEPSAFARRAADDRETHELAGWSARPCEYANAPDHPELGTTGTLDAAGSDATYYAVYETGMRDMSVVFENVMDEEGVSQDVPSLRALYGQTLGEALDQADRSMPQPCDYVQDGTTYRFVGWHCYSSAASSAAYLYGPDTAADDLTFTLAQAGAASHTITVRAVYIAVEPGQHLITFDVDGRVSACAVDSGSYPDFNMADDSTNTTYTTPAKIETTTGVTAIFDSWTDVDSGATYTSRLPRATEDAAYRATYNEVPTEDSVTFHYYIYNKDKGKYEYGPLEKKTTYAKPVQELADSFAAYGSQIGFGNRVYTLQGWAVRSVDKEALFTADNPIPDDATSYSQTYYAIYKQSDHTVKVTFKDGDVEVGSASVPSGKTVDDAFAATGAKNPADKSGAQMFLGWATSAGASKALRGVSTTIQSLTDGTEEAVTLYAVYGTTPVYAVNLRTADGSKVLYQVRVKSGFSVSSALEDADIALDVPTQAGKYFFGWYTAGNKHFNLDDEVTGSMNLYAAYRDIKVTSSDESDIFAAASSSSSKLQGSTSVALTFVPRTSADTPLRTATAKNSYTMLKYYDMRLVATAADGKRTVVTDDFGTAVVKVLVGTKYRNTKVRLFWLGTKDGMETVLNSDAKTVDSQGYITVSVGNYTVGDADEGGNMVVAYKEGGKSDGTLAASKKPSTTPKKEKTPSSSEESSASEKKKGPAKSGKGLKKKAVASPGKTAPGSLQDSATLSETLGSASRTVDLSTGNSLAKGSLSGSLASKSGTLAKNGDSAFGSAKKASGLDGAKKSKDSSGKDAATDGSSSEGEAGAGEGEGAASPFDGWDSDAVVLLLAALAVLLAILAGIRRFFLAAKNWREDEDDFDPEPLAERYADGLSF